MGLLIGAGATYAVTSTQSSSKSSGLSGTITIGDLTDLSGTLSSIGIQQKEAINMAISDINSYLSASGITSYKFAVDHEDTGSNPATALTDLQTLASAGVQVVVGPLSSGEASNILSYANQHHIVLISASSTAIDLAISNDYLFRLVPNDAAQSAAISRALVDNNVSSIVVLYANNVYGNGLANATEYKFEAHGGQDQGAYSYTYPASSYDFTAQLTSMQTAYQAAVSSYGSSHVAILAIGYQEIGTALLNAHTSFPTLLSATWYGSDGEADLPTFTNTTTGVGQVAVGVHMISTIGESPAPTSKYNDFVTRFTQLYGSAPISYAISAYDCAWVAALSIMAVQQNSGQAIQGILPQVANNYFGVTGWTSLQPSGDRVPVGYSIYEVESVSNAPTWILAGTYSTGTDSITWATST